MRKVIVIAVALAMLLIPAAALAADITEGGDYSDIQTSPTKINAAAPFTLHGHLHSAALGGDIDCFTFTANETARYVFSFASDTKVFKPHIGVIKNAQTTDFLTVAQAKGKTPAETARVYYDFSKGEEITVLLTTSSVQQPSGKNSYTLKVTKTNIPSDIVRFALPGIELADVVIDTQAATVTATAPAGSDLTGIVPDMEGSLGERAVFIPAVDVPQDFGRPVKYRLYSELGAPKEWTILIRVEGEKESIADLGEMFVDGQPLEDFSPDVISYDITVPFEQKSIGVVVKPVSERSELSEKFISRELEIGANTISISVTAENGDVKTYTLNVLREAAELVEVGDTQQVQEAQKAQPMPVYVIIIIVIAAVAAVGAALFLLRHKLFFKE